MNEEIKTGDTVMIVRGSHCCGHMGSTSYGQVFIVKRVFPLREVGGAYTCNQCGRIASLDLMVAEIGPRRGVELRMLKKLPPPADDGAFRIKTPAEILADFELGVAVFGTF